MNSDIEIKLWNAGQPEKPYTQEAWHEIIDALLNDFQEFVGQIFQRDPDISLSIENPYNPSFSRWIWSEQKGISPLSVTWSALIGGDMVANEEGIDTFHVSLILFLFDADGDSRLRLKTGEIFLMFAFKKQLDSQGSWYKIGWCKDEYGEWEELG
jgi:hypothetical protein